MLDKTEILLIVALNNINLNPSIIRVSKIFIERDNCCMRYYKKNNTGKYYI